MMTIRANPMVDITPSKTSASATKKDMAIGSGIVLASQRATPSSCKLKKTSAHTANDLS